VTQETAYKEQRASTLKNKRRGSVLDDNQSILADCALDCETNRICNDNFRLDMTWADQEVRQNSWIRSLDQQPALI